MTVIGTSLRIILVGILFYISIATGVSPSTAAAETGGNEAPSIPQADCTTIDGSLKLTIPCIAALGAYFQATLDYCPSPAGSGSLTWQFGGAQIGEVNDYCASFDAALNLLLPCVAVGDGRYQVSLLYSSTQNDTPGNFWTLGGISAVPGNNGPSPGCTPADITVHLPLDYTLMADHVAVHTPGGDLYTLVTPWGSHVQPFTGHMTGDGKSNWMGFVADSLDDPRITVLESVDPTLGCQAGADRCGVHEGIIDARIPTYVAPDDQFSVSEIILEGAPAYENRWSPKKWRIEADICGIHYTLGHIARMADSLRNRLLAAGYVDPELVETPGTNLITGEPIVLGHGEPIAHPELYGWEVPGYPGYYTGPYIVPMYGMEYIVSDPTLPYNQAMYNLLPATQRAGFAAIIEAEAVGAEPLLFSHTWTEPWQWRAEAVLEASPAASFSDTSGILSSLGGWFERAEVACEPFADPACDTELAFFPVHKESAAYDPSLYHSSSVSYLFGLRHPSVPSGVVFGEIIAPTELSPEQGTAVLKYRPPYGDVMYQKIAYRTFQEIRRLKIRWGTRFLDEAAVAAETVAIPTRDEPCDGTTLTCNGHAGYWGGGGPEGEP